MVVLFLLGGLVSCRGQESEVIDEQVFHLESLSSIIAAHPGDTDAIVSDLGKYLQDNMKRLLDARRDSGRMLRAMTPVQRQDFARRSAERTRELRDRIRTAISACPEPERIMALARQLFL